MKTRNPEELSFKWVVLAASFTIRFLLFGSLFSVGVLYVTWLDEFRTSKGNTAWIGSLATGSCLLAGPIGSALISRIGTRKTAILGGLVMSVGMFLSSFATNIYILFVTYGILAGFGGGIANLAAVVRITDYFKKQRAFAMGVGSSGVGLGAFIFTILQQYLLDEYGWKGCLLITSGVTLNICVAGFLMMHPRHHPNFISAPFSDVNKNHSSKELSEISNEISDIANETHNNDVTAKSDVIKDHSKGFLIREESSVAITRRNSSKTYKRRKSSFFQKVMVRMKFKDQTVQLWKDPVFLLLFASDFLSWIVQFVPYVHLPERARLLGISPIRSAIIVSSMGFAGAVGKLFFGGICTFFKLKPFRTFIVAQILFGVSTLLSPICRTFEWLLVYGISFGFLSGSYALMMVIPADLLGQEKFSAAYGFLLAGEGIGVYLGPPIAGWITDNSRNYEASFFCAGAVLLASGIILLLYPCIKTLKN